MCPSKATISINCQICSKQFFVSPQRAETAKFCSYACRGSATKGRTWHEKWCPFCRSDFKTLKRQQRYCSKFCRDKSQKVRNMRVKTCEHCGDIYIRHVNNRDRECQLFCSRQCQIRNRYGFDPAIPKNQPVGSLDKDGYMRLYIDGKHIGEHRYVMEQHLNRKLTRDENVHHLNGNRSDNRLENLELWNTSQPCGQRIPDKVKWAKEILARYDT